MTSPTPTTEQVLAAIREGERIIERSHIDIRPTDAKHLASDIADALAARDAEIATLWKFARTIATIVATPGEESVGDIISIADLPDLAVTVCETIEHRDGRVADLSAKLHELERVHRDTERERVKLDAEIAALRADLDEIRMWLAFGCLPAETYRPGNEAALKAADAKIGDLRANLATAHRERDEARRALAECTILSGDDTDGNTIENGGWVHLWRGAVDAVRQLRADYDEAAAVLIPAPAFKVGDRLTRENIASVPYGVSVTWRMGTSHHYATRIGPNAWECDGERWYDHNLIGNVPAYIHSLPTPEKP